VGYSKLNAVLKGRQKKTRKQAHGELNIGMSGGQKGAATSWGKTLDKYGMPVVHYLAKNQTHGFETRKVKGVRRDLSEKELYSLGHVVDKANETLKRKVSPKNMEYFLSNAHQVKSAKGVFAIGEIETNHRLAYLNGKTVKGSAGWGVQMGIDKGIQKIFVFDQVQKSWFKFDAAADRFKPIDYAPKLTRNPALIGTREMTRDGHLAIEEVAESCR